MPTTSIPRPVMGDVMERTNLNGRHEEAMVVSIMSDTADSQEWQGVLFTKNGTEFVSSDREFRGNHDWRPKGWVYLDDSSCWGPKGHMWCVETNEFVPVPKQTRKTRSTAATATATA